MDKINEFKSLAVESAIETILQEHPELRVLWEHLAELYLEPVINGVNPVSHVYFEAMAEAQITGEDPPEVGEAVARLMQQGFSRHAARAAVAALLIPHFLAVLRDKKPFDREAYVRRLRVLGKIKRIPRRNQPCFCGSGQKYKHCCGPLGSIMTPSRLAGRLVLGYGEYAGPEELAELPPDDPLLLLENRAHVATFLTRNGLAEETWAVLTENLALAREFKEGRYLKKALRDLLRANFEFEMELGGRGLPVVEELLAMAVGEEERRELLCDKADLLAAAGLPDEAEALYHEVMRTMPHWHFGRYRYALFLMIDRREEAMAVLRELVEAKDRIDEETYREARGMLEDMLMDPYYQR